MRVTINLDYRPRWPLLAALAVIVLAVLLAAHAVPASEATSLAHAANRPSAGASVAAGTTIPAAACQPYAATPGLLPFPDNRLTRRDRSTPTGRRLALPAAAMPVNSAGSAIGTAEYDRNDGFSPGSALIVHVPGLDNAQAFSRTNPVGLLDMARSFDRRAPIVVIDEATGRRQLIWSELDANADTPADTNLLIHPGRNFLEGHTYAVALRYLRDASGNLIPAPGWFSAPRDGAWLPIRERGQRRRYDRIFASLREAGIGRRSLYEAWDFTVASERSLSSRLLSIRNDAFAQLGDRYLGDARVRGSAPSYQITSSDMLAPGLRRVQGTFQVPCYLVTCGPTATTGFHYGSNSLDALPTQIPGNIATAPFECIVPSSATSGSPARISLYGHGLLGSHTEVGAGNVRAMATEHNIVFCATDWWGLAQGDTGLAVSAISDLNRFPALVDRLQQGVLNTLYLGRLLRNPTGFAANPDFQSGGRPVIDTSNLYYDGNSQGGIEGGLTTAVAPDFRRAVLGVSGMNYGNVLVQRSTDFVPFAALLRPSYSDRSLYTVILDLIQQLWDRGDPDGYAQHMTSDPLPGTPSHTVLMQIAYGDHQVSMYAAAVQARTIKAFVHEPALDLSTTRARDRNLFYGVPALPERPFGGSAIVIWDSGPGRVQPPPVGNVPPLDSPTNIDPHEDVRNTPAARQQKSDFLMPNGRVVDVCAKAPCRTSVFTP